MSLAYRIRLSASLRRHEVVGDGIAAPLELLDVLPCEQMAGLLRAELEACGFTDEDGLMVRIEEDGCRIVVDPESGTFSLRLETEADLELERSGQTRAATENDRKARARLKERLQQELEREADEAREQIRTGLTEQLERRLAEVRPELDRISTRVVGEALKIKARQLGEVKEISEGEDGSLTIKVQL
jgi:hypothetical protein